MKRNDFLKSLGIGSLVLGTAPLSLGGDRLDTFRRKKPKNIIFLVSDGMSSGTLNMADMFLRRKNGVGSTWLNLYRENRVSRALMDMASASSIVTDSAAASSSWGGGIRVNNGSINIGAKGEEHLPILQKFKMAGKKVGCVTTVPIAHATPAGFCVFEKSRQSMDNIAVQYRNLKFDVMMGGGFGNFSADHREDKTDLLSKFKADGWQVAETRDQMKAANTQSRLLGVFDIGGMPYSIDRQSSEQLTKQMPTLAEMTQKAIENMKNHPKGFVLQVEAGKVDWAAHGNDIAGLLYDQIAFDEAVNVAIDFAAKDKNTLVIITTDHGNANPGLIYGKNADENFDKLQRFKHSNEWILNSFDENTAPKKVIETIEYATGQVISEENAKDLLSSYSNDLKKENSGLYVSRNLPFKRLAELQKSHTSVGWISMDHSSDYVELAMFGPGSEKLKPFVKNTDLHTFMLETAEVENKF